MTTNPIDMSGPHAQRFVTWIEREKAKGLVDVKFFMNDEASPFRTAEEGCAAVMEMIDAPTVTDPELCRLD